MSYSNTFLREFRPVFLGILAAKHLSARNVVLEIIDEEPGGEGIFEPVGVRDVLEQLRDDLNFLTIYTERFAYFGEFAETMYEENGLLVNFFLKEAYKSRCVRQRFANATRKSDAGTVVLDFEWEGGYHASSMIPGNYYVPIHKKPWKKGENLDIMVPIGYNTEIVKSIQSKRKKPRRDRLEEAFYNARD